MAKNTGNGFRVGAILNRFQMLNGATGKYVKFDSVSGRILRNKRSPGPYKGIRVKPPKRTGGPY